MNKKWKLNKIYIGMSISCVGFAANAAPTIWTDADFTSPKGHTWVNPGNPSYGGDVHIQNTQTAEFIGAMNNTGVLSIESGARLVADGHVKTTNTGNGDALLVVSGGKAYFNGGITSVTVGTNGFYSIGVIDTGSQLHVVGDTNIFSPDAIGKGLYLGANTTNSFNGDVNVSAGEYGITTFANNSFTGKIDINMRGNNAIGIFAGNPSTAATTDFDGFIDISIDTISDNTSQTYGIVNTGANNTLNLNSGAQVVFNGENSKAGEYGVYASASDINIKGGLSVQTTDGDHRRAAIYATGTGQVKVSDSVVDLNGNFYASGNSKIDVSMDANSIWTGASYQGGSGVTDVTTKATTWNMTDSSILTNLNTTSSFINFKSTKNNYYTLTLGNLSGNNSTFAMNVALGNITSPIDANGQRIGTAGVDGDLLEIRNAVSGAHRLAVANVGSAVTQGNEVLQIVSTASNNTGNFSLTNVVELGGYKYALRETDDGTGNKIGWELYSKKDITQPSQAAVGSYFNASYLLSYIDTQTLLQRMGELRTQSKQKDNVWIRGFGGRLHSFSGQKLDGFDMDYVGGQIGADKYFTHNSGDMHIGLMGGYTDANPDYQTGSGSMTSYNFGTYATYMMNNGFYLDGAAKYTHVSSKFSVKDSQDTMVHGKTNSNGYGFSLEAGKRFNINESNFYLEPQAQVSYFHQQGSHTQTSNGLNINFSDYTSVLGRLSAVVGYIANQSENSEIHIYAKLGGVREFDGKAHYDLNNSREKYSLKGNWFDGAIGATAQIKGQHNIFGEVGYSNGSRFDKIQLNMGYRYQF